MTIATEDLKDIKILTPEEALRQLGDTADEVAENLRRRGHQGHRGNSGGCPVALYLHEVGFAGARVGAFALHIAPSEKIRDHSIPAIRAFINDFDSGKYPDLIAR